MYPQIYRCKSGKKVWQEQPLLLAITDLKRAAYVFNQINSNQRGASQDLG